MLPSILLSTLQESTAPTSVAAFNKLHGKRVYSDLEIEYFNLTNAHELHTVTPAPAPIFKVRDPAHMHSTTAHHALALLCLQPAVC